MPHHKSTGILSAWYLIWDFILTEGSTEKAPSALRFIFPSHLPVSHCLPQKSQICFPSLDLIYSLLHSNPAHADVIPLTLLKLQEALVILHSRILFWPFHRMPALCPTLSAFHSLHPQVLASRSSGAITGNIIPHRALHTVSSDQESSFSYNVSDSVSNREG